MLAYNINKNEEKIIFETCLATMGAKTKEGGVLITSGENGKNCHIANRNLTSTNTCFKGTKTQLELNIIKFIFPFLMINIVNIHAYNFKANFQIRNKKQSLKLFVL